MHDLKAPLRGIANLVSWIVGDSAGEMEKALRSHVELLRSWVRRLEALVNAALTFARADRLDEGVSDVAVGALVAEVVDLAAPSAEVTVTIEPRLSTLTARRASLQPVWLNLIANAHWSGDDRRDPGHLRYRLRFYFRVSTNSNGASSRSP